MKKNNVGASIIICCYNSAKRLPETLQYLKIQELPKEISWEVIIVDNASTDDTATIAQYVWGELPGVSFRVVQEPKKGLSNARNRGLQEAIGDLICFIDDDVRPNSDWLRNLVEYATETDVDAIAGKVNLPEALRRPWMKQKHRTRLASTENIDPLNPQDLIGANMSFRKRVLERVPKFDPELGAGATGFGEESLFAKQIVEAGFKIGFAEKAVVEHHFEERRLLRAEWLKGEQKRGFGIAYLDHHWEHKVVHNLLPRLLQNVLRLLVWRLSHLKEISVDEGCSIEEMGLVRRISSFRQQLIISRQPHNYEYHGLIKHG